MIEMDDGKSSGFADSASESFGIMGVLSTVKATRLGLEQGLKYSKSSS